ncbi:hypothetical protein FP568_02335 [Pandoraea pnomenusa]|uniref:hypothetical protein n=1 Tax=Pandoraea pnomenusa TaxID=93220 RepID=UPI00119837C9|nr:hypothetical protein [Pandoraea pnomenusa]QDX20206.1 hypothetical protein FP568_02335 [Pandoraea pnomenusa]
MSKMENRDACGMFRSSEYMLVVVMDATDHGALGVEFNGAWLTSIAGLLSQEAPSADDVVSAMREAHGGLDVRRYLHERACYAALLLDGEGNATTLTCGDCRVGLQLASGRILWVSRPHTYSESGVFRYGDQRPVSRHIVTRTLRARRGFESPEMSRLKIEGDAQWIVATDGYWANVASAEQSRDDDASHAIIAPHAGVELDTDCANYILKDYVRDTSPTDVSLMRYVAP